MSLRWESNISIAQTDGRIMEEYIACIKLGEEYYYLNCQECQAILNSLIPLVEAHLKKQEKKGDK